jgi:hypothetical protein
VKESERRIALRNMAGGESEIRAKSADNPISLLGEGLDWVVVDEAARMKPSIWQTHLSQRLIDRKGWALLISTPRGKGWLWDMYQRGQRNKDADYESWQFPSSVNPYLDATLIEAERGRLPERAWREAFNAEFLEGSGQVFRYVREAATGVFHNAVPDQEYVIGLDLAKVEDYSVVCVMNRRHEVVFLDRFRRLDWGVQIIRIGAIAHRYNDAPVYVDSTGSGEPVYEALCRADIQAHPYGFTAKSKDALIQNLCMLLERRRIVLPKSEVCPELVDELEAFEYSVTDAGTVRTGAPSGYHDDCVIALALACWALRWTEDEDDAPSAFCVGGGWSPEIGSSIHRDSPPIGSW